MYISLAQLARSLDAIGGVHPFFGVGFLALKNAGIPIGSTRNVNFAAVAREILNRHYRPTLDFPEFYLPFGIGKRERWKKPRYFHTTLQRITSDTFKDALIHEKRSSEWGWRNIYLAALENHLEGKRIPAFDLAVWLFRDVAWPVKTQPVDVRRHMFSKYQITASEVDALFLPLQTKRHPDWLTDEPVDLQSLLGLIGRPPGSSPEDGAALTRLTIRGVGPAKQFDYEPADRLNILTGDNSLGKTFILDCAWWALTGEWLDNRQAVPRDRTDRTAAKIVSTITASNGRPHTSTSRYEVEKQAWSPLGERSLLPGLVIYARYDGSFAVWDPVRLHLRAADGSPVPTKLVLGNKELWGGLPANSNDRTSPMLCNGLIADWVKWQESSGRYNARFASLKECLKELSPSPAEPMEPGEPVRLPGDSRDIPTVRMVYGDVPVLHASAGVQRVIGLAYLLVWAWHEHVANCELAGRKPQRRIILMIDEVEAHLHPKWQRVIVPSLMSVVSKLATVTTAQVHLATHSPMVMASAETVFDKNKDDLHHLKLENGKVVLEELPFVRRGTADVWLMSDVFGLDQARSQPAEEAMREAKELQLQDEPHAARVREVNCRLVQLLAPDDDFWPRWRYFAKTHGGE